MSISYSCTQIQTAPPPPPVDEGPKKSEAELKREAFVFFMFRRGYFRLSLIFGFILCHEQVYCVVAREGGTAGFWAGSQDRCDHVSFIYIIGSLCSICIKFLCQYHVSLRDDISILGSFFPWFHGIISRKEAERMLAPMYVDAMTSNEQVIVSVKFSW